jgi:hypothetical protein
MTQEHEIIIIAKELIAYSGNPLQLQDRLDRLQAIVHEYERLKSARDKYFGSLENIKIVVVSEDATLSID